LHPKVIRTWAESGHQAVKAKINGDERNCIVVVACVTAAGEKFSYGFIAPGKTTHVKES
jgi:hypothetical protein